MTKDTTRELSGVSVILSVLLSVVLAAANAYLGLFAGMTISASIPAAVVSMAIFRLLRRSNILENNIVQTAASSGEAVAAGVIFTLPALLVLHAWDHFDMWQTTLIACVGGTLGVLFTSPLRHALIVHGDATMKFPEGVATAKVLAMGGSSKEVSKQGLINLFVGALVAGGTKFMEAGLRLWTGSWDVILRVGDGLCYFGSNLSPALLGVGFIVGMDVALPMLLGGILNWWFVIPYVSGGLSWPIYTAMPNAIDWPQFVLPGAMTDYGFLAKIGTEVSAKEWAWELWSKRSRYLGVGAMVVGGLWGLWELRPTLVRTIRQLRLALADKKRNATTKQMDQMVDRTRREIPLLWIGIGVVASVIPITALYMTFTASIVIGMVMALVMVVAGFLFSAVAGTMAGFLGSSNNPISGITLATILFSALVLMILGVTSHTGPQAAVLVGAVVCCAAAMAGDNLQDLKTGYILGATPYKQQIAQLVGVFAASLVIGPTLNILLRAYGIGVPTAEHMKPLLAPQATLVAHVSSGVFQRNLPWAMVGLGALIAMMVIGSDCLFRRRGIRLPVLAVAVGLYLPLELSVAVTLGALLSQWVVRADAPGRDQGILLASGLITGESLMGIILAIPILVSKGQASLAVFGEKHWPVLGALFFGLSAWLLVRSVRVSGQSKAVTSDLRR